MPALEAVRDALPEAAKDIRLNLQAVLEGGVLTPAQKWGVAAASAVASRNPALRDALLGDAREQAGEAVVEDARAAAVLMAMNNVEGGLTEEPVHEAVRIAAVIHAAAVGLES